MALSCRGGAVHSIKTRLVHRSKTGPLFDHLTLDRGAMHLKDVLMPKYPELVCSGFWFSPERDMLQAAIDRSRELVGGVVRLKLCEGNVAAVGRPAPYSLHDQDLRGRRSPAITATRPASSASTRCGCTLGQRRKKLGL